MGFSEMLPGRPGNGRFLTKICITFFFYYSCILLICLNIVTCQFIEVQTELGRVRGVRIQSQMNNPAIAFLGIPYALPPTGERRFRVKLVYFDHFYLYFFLNRGQFLTQNGHQKHWWQQTTNPAARN